MNRLSISNFSKERREKFLVWAILMAFLSVAALEIAVSQNAYLWKRLVIDPSHNGQVFNGDLYGMSLVSDFQDRIVELPETDGITTIDKAKYIPFGDSFFATGYDSPPVFDFLQSKLSGGVYYHSFPVDPTPFSHLSQAGYQKGAPKVLIWETAEFYSIDRALVAGASAGLAGTASTSLKAKLSGLISRVGNFLAFFKPNRGREEYFVENNILVEPLRAWLKTKAFEWFGDIDGQTPIYSTNPKMLFLNDDVTFRENTGKIAQIPELADNIAKVALVLKHDYNLQLVYMVVPNKLSVYADWLNQPNPYAYDNYIPLLQKALADRGVTYVDVYSAYVQAKQKNPSQLLYYPGDHHFTPLGKTILEDALLKKLQSLPG